MNLNEILVIFTPHIVTGIISGVISGLIVQRILEGYNKAHCRKSNKPDWKGVTDKIINKSELFSKQTVYCDDGIECTGDILLDMQNKLTDRYHSLQDQFENNEITRQAFDEGAAKLLEEQHALFGLVNSYTFTDDETDQLHQFYRSIMKYPTPIDQHRPAPVPITESQRLEYCDAVAKMDKWYATPKPIFPSPDDYDSVDDFNHAYDKWADEYINPPHVQEVTNCQWYGVDCTGKDTHLSCNDNGFQKLCESCSRRV